MPPLEEIIQRINEEFMGEFTDAVRVIVETLYNKMRWRWRLMLKIQRHISSCSWMQRSTTLCRLLWRISCIGNCIRK